MENRILDFTFIPLIIVLSFFIIRDDVKHKKIKNKFILLGFLGGFLLFLLGFLLGFVQLVYLMDVLMNFCVSLVVAYFFWQFAFWPAGDAKLFALFSFLLPLHFYWRSYLPFFPSLAFLANIFICAYGFLLLSALFHFGKLISKEKFSWDEFIAAREFFSVSFLKSIRLALRKINFLLFGKNLLMLGLIFLTMHYLFNLRQNLDYASVKIFVLGVSLWALVSWLIKKYIGEIAIYTKNIDDLQIGNLPLITTENGEVFSPEFLNKLGKIRAEGINNSQVELIKAEFKSEGRGNIFIQKELPFSPWIIIGLMVTVILSGGVLQFMGKLFVILK